MTTTKTPGQVAYEAFREMSKYPFEWDENTDPIRASWEKIAQAVVQHHEEQREQTQRRSGRTTRMLLDAYYALMETQEPRPVVVVGGNARQADTLFRIFGNRILGENPRWCWDSSALEIRYYAFPDVRCIRFVTYAEYYSSDFWRARPGKLLVFEDHAASDIYHQGRNNMKPRTPDQPAKEQ